MDKEAQVMNFQNFVDILQQPGVIETAETGRDHLKYVLLCRDCSDPNLLVELKDAGYIVIIDRCQNCRNEFDRSSVPAMRDVLIYYDLIKE